MLFFELIQLAIGNRRNLSRIPAEEEWQEIYQEAEKQALVGFLLTAVEKLNELDKASMPPMQLFYQWIGDALQIENRNKEVSYAAAKLTRIFKEGGMSSCVLKGQGIAQLYPKPERRQPGDVDLWVEGGREKVLRFMKDSYFARDHVVIHHVESQIIDGVVSEIHFIPCYSCNPFLHVKLQRFFAENAEEQFLNLDDKLGFAYPTLRFNAVYLLSHIYMHFLYEGIGLRQFVDYYYVLHHLNSGERKQAIGDIREAGLSKIAGAVMYVLKTVCGLSEEYYVADLDEKKGKILLDEIIKNGNFGKYNTKLNERDDNNLIAFNLVALRRQLTFLRYYPLDVISIPFFKVWHWTWRLYKGYLKIA